jgi:group II intron reverse transcriptase/maturase
VKDRVVQTAAKLVLEPIFEPDFEPNSYGFRPDKSAHEAVTEIVKWLNFGCEQGIDADITAFFDTIPKGLLIREVARRVVNGAMLHLVKQWLDAGILDGGVMTHSESGTPQGSPLSPLLANIHLDRLDKQWGQSGLPARNRADAHLVRYADDFVVVGKRGMKEAMAKLTEIIGGIGLTLSTEKTRLVNAGEGFDFLGFHFVRHYSRRREKRVT